MLGRIFSLLLSISVFNQWTDGNMGVMAGFTPNEATYGYAGGYTGVLPNPDPGSYNTNPANSYHFTNTPPSYYPTAVNDYRPAAPDGNYLPSAPAGNYFPTNPPNNYSPTASTGSYINPAPAGNNFPTAPTGNYINPAYAGNNFPTVPTGNYINPAPAGNNFPTVPAGNYFPAAPAESYPPGAPAGGYSPDPSTGSYPAPTESSDPDRVIQIDIPYEHFELTPNEFEEFMRLYKNISIDDYAPSEIPRGIRKENIQVTIPWDFKNDPVTGITSGAGPMTGETGASLGPYQDVRGGYNSADPDYPSYGPTSPAYRPSLADIGPPTSFSPYLSHQEEFGAPEVSRILRRVSELVSSFRPVDEKTTVDALYTVLNYNYPRSTFVPPPVKGSVPLFYHDEFGRAYQLSDSNFARLLKSALFQIIQMEQSRAK